MSAEASGERAIAADHIVNAFTGDVSAVVLTSEVLNAARDIQAPHGLSNLGPVPMCLGRDDELAWLRRTLAEGGRSAITQPSAIHGLGGVGKSTLALAYAHHYRSDYSMAWWINADSPVGIERSLSEMTRRLFPAWAGQASEREEAAWAMSWLQWHPDWLLVFDNVEDPCDLTPYTGALTGGHVIITSRKATGWPASTPTHALDLLAPDEAAHLLCQRALGHDPTVQEREAARPLAADLGYLPIALEQAAAYLHEAPTVTFEEYRLDLQLNLDQAPESANPERTIARVWTPTFRALRKRNPQAITVLHTLAWLAPESIPVTLLGPLVANRRELTEALRLLRAYSMITLTREAIGIHRLVQAVLRYTPPTELGQLPPGRRDAEQALTLALDEKPEDGRLWEDLTPHLIALAATTPPSHPDDAAVPLYIAAAERLLSRGQDALTIPLRQAILTQREQVRGNTHPDTLACRNNLADAYRGAGNLKRAIPLLETTLAQCEQVLGNSHPDTLRVRNNLASMYQDIGDLARAIPLLETTLAQCVQALGDTDPSTLTSRNNLADAYQDIGDFTRAIPLLETTLRQREEVLGDTHPHTLASRNNLANAYSDAGDLKRAIPLLTTTASQCEQVLGNSHPLTLTSLNNLASAYRNAGDLKRAIPLLEIALAQCEQVLGDTHPETLIGRNNLAITYREADDHTRAIPLLEIALAQCEQVLGDTNPQTLTSRLNLAVAYQEVGDLDRAIPLLKGALAQSEQVLGDTHPQTLASRHNLAAAYLDADDLQNAISVFEIVLAQSEQVLGSTHPRTLGSAHNLAAAYGRAGDYARAIPLLETVLHQYEEVFGDTHPNTRTSRNNLAAAYLKAGDLTHAIPLLKTPFLEAADEPR